MQRTDISDLIDQTFGELTVTGIANPYISPKGRTETQYLCRCSCGNNKIYRRSQLVTNRVVSCGCKRNNFWNLYNEQTRSCYIGKRYGKLTVESYDKNSGKYLCRCDCGTKTLISVSNLKSAKSCGCAHHKKINPSDIINTVRHGYWIKQYEPLFYGEKTMHRYLCECTSCKMEKRFYRYELLSDSLPDCPACKARNDKTSLVGTKIGHFTITNVEPHTLQKNSHLTLQCDCGETIRVNYDFLTRHKDDRDLHCKNCNGDKTNRNTLSYLQFESGLTAKAIDFENTTDTTIEFEDGIQREHVSLSHFRKGEIAHPILKQTSQRHIVSYFGFEVKGKAFSSKGIPYYYARKEDGQSVTWSILTAKQMYNAAKMAS